MNRAPSYGKQDRSTSAAAVYDCLRAGDGLVRAISGATRIGGLHVSVLRCAAAPGSDAQATQVASGASALLCRIADLERQYRQGVSPGSARVVAVVSASAPTIAYRALTEAARGVAQSVTDERLPGVRNCAVVTHLGDRTEDLIRTLRFLASPAGGFVAGSWIDLGVSP